MSVATYTKSGAKAATPAKLNKKVFGVEIKNHDLLKSAYLAYLANGRANLAITKKRGEVRGGGKKPWRQKGTGRARFGSSRNPIWRGGGVAFGPTGNENYSRKLSTRSKHQALCQALSLAAKEDRLKVIDSFSPAGGKVKAGLSLLSKIGAEGSILVVDDTKNEEASRSTQNIANVKLVLPNYLNVHDILNADQVIITTTSLEVIHKWLGDAIR